jgi:hypothetical protein
MSIKKDANLEPLGILHPSENLGAVSTAGSGPGKTAYCSSPSYIQAVIASRFVKGFGITALICSILSLLIGQNLLLGGGIGLGVGLFIFRSDKAQFYRALGIVVMIVAIIGGLLPFLNPAIISSAVLWKGKEALGILSKEGRDDGGWKPARKGALIGIAASCGGLLVSLMSMLSWIIKIASQ